MTATRARTYILDTIVDTPGRGAPVGPVGTPVSIEVERPDTVWFDLAMDQRLKQWAADGRVVDVSVAAAGARRTARLEADGASFRCPLVSVR